KCLQDVRPQWSFGFGKYPGLVHQVCQLNLATPGPGAVRPRNDHDRIVVEELRIEIVFGERSGHAVDDEIDVALSQLARQRFGLDSELDAWMLLQNPVDDDADESCRNCIRTADPKFARGRIG